MLRRPPTSIQLKLDDISEYEEKQQELARSSMGKQPYNDLQWNPKSKQEVHARIGYIPDKPQTSNRANMMN